MPGLTAPLTAPYDAAVKELLNSPDSLTEQSVTQQLKPLETPNTVALEIAVRNEFYNILANNDIDDEGFQRMWQLLDAVNIASDALICDAVFPFLLIEDLLDCQTIHGCRKVFDYLESRRERLTEKHLQNKKQALLRICNGLLKRLSRAEDTVFCGRVFIFLFQSFPLGDKSSVNLRGEYHTDNVTHYDQTATQTDPEAMAVDAAVDATAENAAQAAPTIKVDGKEAVDTESLYSTFWSMQEYFATPTKLFESSNLSNLKSGLEKTMLKFKEVYREEPRTGSRTDESRGVKRKADDLDGNAFNPKYLTSRDMFELELHDPAFRRHILVQALIVTDFLLSQTSKAKKRLADMRNKSVVYSFTLEEQDAKWASNMRADIAAYLQQSTEGRLYYRMVDTVLSRDKNWLRWKAESCPPFSLDSVEPSGIADSRSSLQKSAGPRQIRKAPMGALDLGFLGDQDQTEPLDKYQNSSRWHQPELGNFRNEIANTDMDLEMADGEEKEKLEEQKSSKIWRAIRIGGRFSVLDKLDLESRDGLDPLFGISRESEHADEEDEEVRNSEEPSASAPPDDGPAQVDGSADEPGSTRKDAMDVEVEDGVNPDDRSSGEDKASNTEVPATQVDTNLPTETPGREGSAESSLSPVDSEVPNPENALGSVTEEKAGTTTDANEASMEE